MCSLSYWEDQHGLDLLAHVPLLCFSVWSHTRLWRGGPGPSSSLLHPFSPGPASPPSHAYMDIPCVHRKLTIQNQIPDSQHPNLLVSGTPRGCPGPQGDPLFHLQNISEPGAWKACLIQAGATTSYAPVPAHPLSPQSPLAAGLTRAPLPTTTFPLNSNLKPPFQFPCPRDLAHSLTGKFLVKCHFPGALPDPPHHSPSPRISCSSLPQQFHFSI